MKRPLLLLLALCCACTFLDTGLPLGNPRAFEQQNGRKPSHQADSAAAHSPDTSFYVSAVTFPSAYNWQRDTAYGAVACTLKLYRGAVQLLSVPAGPSQRISASPDYNHIIGDALFSVYTDFRGTTVKRNGVQLADWSQKETVTGILLKDGILHTIGVEPSGRCFTYRRNGEVVLKIDNASVFGGFNSSSYGPSGAVYEDKGQVCFAYSTFAGAAYLVRDGNAELLISSPTAEFLDVKQTEGITAILYNDGWQSLLSFGGTYYDVNDSGALHWDSGEVLNCGGIPAILGHFKWKDSPIQGHGLRSRGMMWCFSYDYFYCYGTAWENVYFSQPRPGWEKYYFFNRSCAAMVGRDMAAVLTPRAQEEPFLAFRRDTIRYNIHGFLSGVAVKIK